LTREFKSNCDSRTGKYDCDLAQRKYKRRQRDTPRRTDLTMGIKETIKAYLHHELSPEQIVGVFSKQGVPCVPTESIYQHIWKDKK
jgi:IS30 family transposase